MIINKKAVLEVGNLSIKNNFISTGINKATIFLTRRGMVCRWLIGLYWDSFF